MALKKLYLENFTVFEQIEMEFCNGINVLIGENGLGKTHLLKLLYAFYESDTLMQNSKLLFFETLSQCFLTEQFSSLFHEVPNPLKAAIHVNEKEYAYQAIYNDGLAHDEQLQPPLDHIEVSLQIAGERTKEKARTVFIPAKEMLTHAGIEKDYVERHIPFDKTLVDILFKSGVSELRTLSPVAQEILETIKKIVGGTVLFDNDRYYILHNQQKISFQSEAEGFKKLSALWRLVETGLLQKGAVLFWDEPEANINPQYIPVLVELLYALQKSGIQIILATHDYLLAKYLEIKKKDENTILFHSLYHGKGTINVESNSLFMGLTNNSIADAYNRLLDEVFEQTTRG